MPADSSRIRFNATLMRQEAPAKGKASIFLVLQPDGKKCHWHKLTAGMLKGASAAKATWTDITPIARRILNACNMLGSGKRRVCCFDRSGFYSKSLGELRAAR